MTYSILGTDTHQVKETDPRTGNERIKYLPKINQQTGKEERVYLPKSSRLQGTYIIGATGAGKSGLLENLIRQDIKQKIGVFVKDPHGDLINKIIAGHSDDEVQRTILLDFTETAYQGIDYYPGLNIYQCDDPADDDLVTETHGRIEHLFDVVTLENSEEKLGVRVSQGIRNSAYTLMDSSPAYGCTMLELPLLFQEDVVRAKLASHLTDVDATVKAYWQNYERFDRVEKASRAEMVVNKIEGYIINRKLRRIIGQSKNTLNFREVMDCKPGKIVLVKLPGDNEGMTELLGKMLIAQLLAAAMSRKDIPPDQRKQFHIYCDEFELYASDDFTRLLKECRKYGMAVTIAHQSRDFIDLRNKAASLQVANLIVLRIIRKDADELAGNFDCRPIRTKKILRQKTDPFYRTWEETVWIENGEELYKEALRQYEIAYEAEHTRLQALLTSVQIEEEENLVLWRYTQEAERIMTPKPWMHILLDEKVEPLIGQLIEVNERRHTDSFLLYSNPPLGNFRKWKKTNITYSYLEREERYTVSPKTLTNFQIDFRTWREYSKKVIRPGTVKKKDDILTVEADIGKKTLPAIRETTAIAIFNNELDAFERDLNDFTETILAEGVWFTPELKPTPWDGYNPSDGVMKDHFSWSTMAKWSKGILTDEVVKEITNYPLLARSPQPKIGQKRNIRGWAKHGSWRIHDESRMQLWQSQWEQVFEERIKERFALYQAAFKQRLNAYKQLAELEEKDGQRRDALKAQFQEIILHSEYVGELPVVHTRMRTTISHTTGSSERINPSKWGPMYIEDTRESTTIATTPYDTQLYEWVDELDQTHDQRRDEIASEIAMLPDYVARVRIKEKRGDKEELVEYTIRTQKPEEGLPDEALKERISQIKTTMIESKIIRPKHEIDEEIRQRQQLLRLPPQKPSDTEVLLPPTDGEPPVTRRQHSQH